MISNPSFCGSVDYHVKKLLGFEISRT